VMFRGVDALFCASYLVVKEEAPLAVVLGGVLHRIEGGLEHHNVLARAVSEGAREVVLGGLLLEVSPVLGELSVERGDGVAHRGRVEGTLDGLEHLR